MIEFVQTHGLAVLLASWIISNAVSSMPTPHDGSSPFYEWFFRFSQAIGGALPRLLAIYSPATLSALTGQNPKVTTPPNPPVSDGSGGTK
jgi:hypothetical protein